MKEETINFFDCVAYLVRNNLEMEAIEYLCEQEKIKMQKLRSENASRRASMRCALKINEATCKNDAIHRLLEDE